MHITGARYSDVTSGSPTEPVTITEAKAHMRVVSTDDNTYITDLITRCRIAAENFCSIDMVAKTRKLFMDSYPLERGSGPAWWDGVRQGDMSLIDGGMTTGREIKIAFPPLVGVSAFISYDDSDTPTTFNSSNYYVSKADNHRRGRVVLRRGSVWPVVLRVAEGIEIDFTSGYGGSGPAIPSDLKQAILMLMQYAYRNRGDKVDLEAFISPSGAAAMLLPYQDLER